MLMFLKVTAIISRESRYYLEVLMFLLLQFVVVKHLCNILS
jgi:hypothetical protein